MNPVVPAVAILLALSLTEGAQVDPSRLDHQGRLHHQERSESSPILAFYDFEQPTPSGPDTFWVRRREGNEVALSDAFRVSGERSLHISEVPGNRDFAEFLAYFRQRDEGLVFIQFYLLLTDPEQRFNFGLAGPQWFLSAERHGHAIWLQTANGVFRHRPKEGWRELFAPRPFAWYFIDFVYDVADGTYDLRIHEEGLEEPLVDLHDATSFHGHTDSAVRYFSLIGDLEDAGSFDFFVDDLMIATDPEVRLEPFVAPGRRRYFVEMLTATPASELSGTDLEDLIWQSRRWLEGIQSADRERLDQIEETADAAFLAGRLDFAAEAYNLLLDDPDREVRMLLKLSDVAHLAGDTAQERELRESIYGRLDIERH